MKRVVILAACAVGAAVSLAAFAADDPNEKAIKARRGFMQVVGFNAGALFAMAKGERDYDAAAATNFAKNLSAAAAMHNPEMWPDGSDNSNYAGDTRLKPGVSFAELDEANRKLVDASAALAVSAGKGLDALKGDIRALGESCKGCHDEHRAKDF